MFLSMAAGVRYAHILELLRLEKLTVYTFVFMYLSTVKML